MEFQFDSITPDSVLSKLAHLPSGKSCGPDLVMHELLKLAGTSISDSLATLFNRPLADAVFPDMWKEATITPHPKEGKDPTQPTLYRPIVLLSCIAKVFERFVYEQLLKFRFENDVLPKEQFRFFLGAQLSGSC